MKKIISVFLAVLLLASLAVTPAFASNYDSDAQQLSTLGLFKGTGASFDLDRAPTRAEAAVMLVRLLGKDNDAKTQLSAKTISEPFTDVPDWATAEVAWLYSNKLANGVSDTAFGSTDSCNAQMFCTFVLRALGYSDAKGDFTYAASTDYATKLGLYNASFLHSTFLRDDAAAVSYQALATYIKGGTTTLLDKLISDGAVTADSAKSLKGTVTTYLAYCKLQSACASINAVDMSMTGNVKLSSPDMAELNTTANIDGSVKAIVGKDIQAAALMNITTAGTKVPVNVWIKDSNMYMSASGSNVKQALPASVTTALAAKQAQGGAAPAIPLYALKAITASTTSTGTTYTVDLSQGLNSIDLSQLGAAQSLISNLKFNNCTETITFDSTGKPVSIAVALSMNVTVSESGKPLSIGLEENLTMTLNAIGSNVSITYPDFSGYVAK